MQYLLHSIAFGVNKISNPLARKNAMPETMTDPLT